VSGTSGYYEKPEGCFATDGRIKLQGTPHPKLNLPSLLVCLRGSGMRLLANPELRSVVPMALLSLGGTCFCTFPFHQTTLQIKVWDVQKHSPSDGRLPSQTESADPQTSVLRLLAPRARCHRQPGATAPGMCSQRAKAESSIWVGLRAKRCVESRFQRWFIINQSPGAMPQAGMTARC
jgi:hypothetical protein